MMEIRECDTKEIVLARDDSTGKVNTGHHCLYSIP